MKPQRREIRMWARANGDNPAHRPYCAVNMPSFGGVCDDYCEVTPDEVDRAWQEYAKRKLAG